MAVKRCVLLLCMIGWGCLTSFAPPVRHSLLSFRLLCFSDLMILFLPPSSLALCPAALSSRRLAYRMKMGTLPNPKSPKKPVCKFLLRRIPLHLSALFHNYSPLTCSISHYQLSSLNECTQS